PFCRGRGQAKPGSRATCVVCRGQGVVAVSGPVEICPSCQGKGRALSQKLPCRMCSGKGVTAAPRTAGRPRPAESNAMETATVFNAHGGTEELATRELAVDMAIIGRKTSRAPLSGAVPPARTMRESKAPGMVTATVSGAREETGIQTRQPQTAGAAMESPTSQKPEPDIWQHKGLVQWVEENQPQNLKDGRRHNSASMAVMLRTTVARERALALGKPRRGPHALELEQQAAAWQRKQEQIASRTRQETAMLHTLVQLMGANGAFDTPTSSAPWSFGRVDCLATRVPEGGWNLTVVASDKKSRFITRHGWSELLGTYHAQLDDQLVITHHSREIPQEAAVIAKTIPAARRQAAQAEGKHGSHIVHLESAEKVSSTPFVPQSWGSIEAGGYPQTPTRKSPGPLFRQSDLGAQC
ncbi:MAG: hypothetical protein NTU41_11295, partial [Chloroflexi bacterium]|nr:hypothetical protein [Chloroflexota bacterium]